MLVHSIDYKMKYLYKTNYFFYKDSFHSKNLMKNKKETRYLYRFTVLQ